ncbi:MAG: rubredoxin [Giesbergeria sp.]
MRSQVPADARLECKICWWVYDPAEGDPVWQIPPGTPVFRPASALALSAV